jgi:CheY-like chemotaxis protein
VNQLEEVSRDVDRAERLAPGPHVVAAARYFERQAADVVSLAVRDASSNSVEVEATIAEARAAIARARGLVSGLLVELERSRTLQERAKVLIGDQLARTQQRDAKHSRLKGYNILVIEDHLDSRDILCEFIAFMGGTVHAAANGTEALALAAASGPDLILCDLHMPGMDGYTVMERLRADPMLKRVPVVAVSGVSGVDDERLIAEAGFAAHLVKPIEPDELISALGRLLKPRAT